jgi:hypothetical protein
MRATVLLEFAAHRGKKRAPIVHHSSAEDAGPALSGGRPASGEVVGLMVSGLARSRVETAHERSNVVMVRWP